MENLELQKVANEVRKDIVTALHAAKAGHPGGSLSAADLFTGQGREQIINKISINNFIYY